MCAENACVVLCEGYTDPEVIKRPASQKEDIELEVPLLTLKGSGLGRPTRAAESLQLVRLCMQPPLL